MYRILTGYGNLQSPPLLVLLVTFPRIHTVSLDPGLGGLYAQKDFLELKERNISLKCDKMDLR